MNDRLYAVCNGIPDEARKADRQLFFRSIHGTLNHLLYGDIAWMSRFLGEKHALPAMGADLYSDFEELSNARKSWNEKIHAWTRTLTNEWLSTPYTYTSVVDNKQRTLQYWILVTHMFNHGTHHRGQLTTALSELGLDYGSTDIPFMPIDY
jgi:DNA phosphorothioation-dependent restriction protein DptG